MKGLTLLKNIKRGNVQNGDEFIYQEEGSSFNKCRVCLGNDLLFFNIFGEKHLLTSKELLNGEFISFKEYLKNQLIMNWIEENMNKDKLFYFHQNDSNKNIIDCYFKCDDTHFCEFYKDRIARLINEQEKIKNA